MNSVVCAPIESKQPNILSMFAGVKSEKTPTKKILPKSTVSKSTTTEIAVELPSPVSVGLTSEDPLVTAFYKSLSPSEMIAHRIATVKLGTSYDVTRTRGFLAWSKTRTAS